MQLGVLVEAEEGLDWRTWRAVLRQAERLGFESVWIADHLASPWFGDRHGIEPWVALSVAAAETARVRLGTLVSPITFRQPALMARMAEAIDDLAPGRFVLGLGLGWNADEHARFGIAFPAAQTRARLLAEGIHTVRQVLGERHIPILVGGGGPRSTLPIVARQADLWNLTTASVELFEDRGKQLDDLCGEVGRDPHAIGRSVAVGFLIGRDKDDLRERGTRLQRLVPPLRKVDGAAARLGWLAGTPTEIVASLRLLAAAGADLAMLGHYDLTDTAALELIAGDVMPALL
jgi:alkanesulfonate monooxygenase SsuD/methylene tetrahydromethanopterin reductase-like flavin-dependent oxidoreductase (luciferase family)